MPITRAAPQCGCSGASFTSRIVQTLPAKGVFLCTTAAAATHPINAHQYATYYKARKKECQEKSMKLKGRIIIDQAASPPAALPSDLRSIKQTKVCLMSAAQPQSRACKTQNRPKFDLLMFEIGQGVCQNCVESQIFP